MNGDQSISRVHPGWGTPSIIRAIVFLSLVLGTALCVQGQTSSGSPSQVVAPVPQTELPAKWSEGVKALAERIVAAVKPSSAISLEVKNLSSLGPPDVEAIRKALASELASRGIRADTGEIRVIVTLSENAEGYVWVSEIQGSKQSQVAMIQVKRNDSSVPATSRPVLQSRIVAWSKNPILDFASLELEKTVSSVTLVFGFKFLQTIEFIPGQVSDSTFRLKGLSSGPRDLRGLISASRDGVVKMFVAGDDCVGRVHSEPSCGPSSSGSWPLTTYGIVGHFAGNRNYFTGFVNGTAGRLSQHGFYSAAIGINAFDGSNPIIEAELDGKSRLYKDGESAIATFENWGDEITSINRSCGANWEILVTGKGDWTEPDHIQAYEVSLESRSAKPVGQPLEFSGPILAMWPSPDEKWARVISRNLQTGVYEASIITVTCSR